VPIYRTTRVKFVSNIFIYILNEITHFQAIEMLLVLTIVETMELNIDLELELIFSFNEFLMQMWMWMKKIKNQTINKMSYMMSCICAILLFMYMIFCLALSWFVLHKAREKEEKKSVKIRKIYFLKCIAFKNLNNMGNCICGMDINQIEHNVVFVRRPFVLLST